MKYKFLRNLFLLFVISFFLPVFTPVQAYMNNTSASIVLGQSDFTSNSSGVSQSAMNSPRGMCVWQNKLVVLDLNNNRLLIWNSLPTQNNQPADLVIGQPDFNTNTQNTGGVSAHSLNQPFGVFCATGKMIVADEYNHRVLIWNSIPTVNNQDADLVLGQKDFTSNLENQGRGAGSPTAATMRLPYDIYVEGTKLLITDSLNQRLLIWNTFPTQNGQNADVVVGQYDMTTNNFDNSNPARVACGPNSLGGTPSGLYVYHGKLIVANTFPVGGHRVTIYNQIPTANGAQADTVIGAPNLTTCGANVGGLSDHSLNNPFSTVVDSRGRLFITDRSNSRILIYNTLPTTNGASADRVLGQPDFTHNTINQGAINSNTFWGARMIVATNDRLYVADGENNRVLIFNDPATAIPGLIGSWKMEENAWNGTTGEVKDSSGNNYNGVALNGTSLTTGKFGTAANFNGVNNAIRTTMLTNPSTITLSTWIKIKSYNTNTSNYPRIISKLGAFELIMYTYPGGEGRLEWDIRLPQETDTFTSYADRLQLNTWYNIVTSYDGTTSKIYINGQKVAERVAPGAITDNRSWNVTIGAVGHMQSSFANADIDDVRIYNRALSDAEVLQLYNN